MNGSTFILNILFQLCETIKKLRRIIPYLSRKLYIRFIFYARFNYSFYLDEDPDLDLSKYPDQDQDQDLDQDQDQDLDFLLRLN